MTDSRQGAGRGTRSLAERTVVGVLAIVFVTLWTLSLPSVRGRMAHWRWDRGDIEGALRLANRAARQRPELADMWFLQGRSEQELARDCDAALSYARAAMAADEATAGRAATLLTGASTTVAQIPDPWQDSEYVRFRRQALERALQTAASCPEIGTRASIFEALTTGAPSAGDRTLGFWPGTVELATNRITPRELARLLPDAPADRLGWIDFLWRRGENEAALAGLDKAVDDEPPASFHWLRGQVLLAIGRDAEALDAFRRAVTLDAGWLPALERVASLDPDEASGGELRQRPLTAERARVDAGLFEIGADSFVLYSNGSLSFDLDLPTSARAFLLLELRGMAANGGYPFVDVSVDGMRISTVEATDAPLPVAVELAPRAGEGGRISLSFANDWSDATGDRNVFVSKPTLLYAEQRLAAREPR